MASWSGKILEALPGLVEAPVILCVIILILNSARLRVFSKDQDIYREPYRETRAITFAFFVCLGLISAGKAMAAWETWLALTGSLFALGFYTWQAAACAYGCRSRHLTRSIEGLTLALGIGLALIPETGSWSAMPLMTLTYLRHAQSISREYKRMFDTARDLTDKILRLESENGIRRMARITAAHNKGKSKGKSKDEAQPQTLSA